MLLFLKGFTLPVSPGDKVEKGSVFTLTVFKPSILLAPSGFVGDDWLAPPVVADSILDLPAWNTRVCSFCSGLGLLGPSVFLCEFGLFFVHGRSGEYYLRLTHSVSLYFIYFI